jgi:hypothetical protein
MATACDVAGVHRPFLVRERRAMEHEQKTERQ